MKQKALFEFEEENRKLLNLKEASIWASHYLNRQVTVSNLSYLVQYGKVKKYGNGKNILIDIEELRNYYDTFLKRKNWGELEEGINWYLSFSQYKESERTKHVHRLHPYKGKFIPQLVEYFLDAHTDEFKKEVYFQKGDIVLDPFCGSGTTLVQANELGIHAIGVDISYFNSLISNVKVTRHNFKQIATIISELTNELESFQRNQNNVSFEEHLSQELEKFNSIHFPSPHFKRKISRGLINEKEYGAEKVKQFLPIYEELLQKYNIQVEQEKQETFLDQWFLNPVRKEIDFLAEKIRNIQDEEIQNVFILILSRTVRSCRATTHSDLATLKKPVTAPYYCKKHGKICKPLFSITKWWKFYAADTLNRLREFDKIRTNTLQVCITGDSRTIDLYEELKKYKPELAELLQKQKIRGIFTSPPYVGLIDYHEQHAYAYELFKFQRNDHLEIGPLSKGQGKQQRKSYVDSIAQVLLNCKKYLQPDCDVFLVANDKYHLYPQIAELAGMKIVNEFKRPVLCRVEKNRQTPYYESIFHLKEK